MNCSKTGFPILLYIPELTQTYVQWVSDVIQPSPLSSPFPPAFYLSQQPDLRIRWPKYWSFSFRSSPSNEYSGLISLEWLVWSPCCPRDSQESSPTPQLEDISSSVPSPLYGPVFTSSLLYPSTFLCIHPINFWEFDIETPAKNFDIST